VHSKLNETFHEDVLRKRQQPFLIVISGPSGVGKDSVLKRMKDRGVPFSFVVTANSRAIRPGEVDGEDYIFVDKEEFERMIADDELFEHALVYKDYKGIPKIQVRQALESGRDVIMRIDVQGAETVRKLAPEALLIFLSPASEEELRARLIARRTESPEDLEIRMETVREELKKTVIFDYIVTNTDGMLDTTVDNILAIIRAEHHRQEPRKVSL
jgi:guanylate kinase